MRERLLLFSSEFCHMYIGIKSVQETLGFDELSYTFVEVGGGVFCEVFRML